MLITLNVKIHKEIVINQIWINKVKLYEEHEAYISLHFDEDTNAGEYLIFPSLEDSFKYYKKFFDENDVKPVGVKYLKDMEGLSLEDVEEHIHILMKP